MDNRYNVPLSTSIELASQLTKFVDENHSLLAITKNCLSIYAVRLLEHRKKFYLLYLCGRLKHIAISVVSMECYDHAEIVNIVA